MTDDATGELLSRYIDDDLESHQRLDLERRLAADPELARELHALIELRDTISELARGMAAPARLDAMLEPIRRAVPPRAHRLHPAVRWLATAAALVVGVTLAVEVARRTPSEPERTSTKQPPRTPQAVDHDRGIFQLRPLPTSSVPDEQAPLGAVDRLMASPLPDPEVPRPEPLDIIGPLPEAPRPAGSATRATASCSAATLEVEVGEQSKTVSLNLLEPLPPGTFRVVLEISDQRVVAVRPEHDDRSEAVLLPHALLGATLPGMPDGRYGARLVVQAPGDR